MKFTLSWLKDHLETDATTAEIAEALTDLGLEVEEVIDPAQRLAAFTLGQVTSAEQHPDADRLKVCQVQTVDGPQQIVCGAPNARAGITVVVARPGTYVPGIDTTIQVGRIRGVESHGMMCSEREMELSDEHDGIIELSSGDVGQPFADWLAQHDPAKVDPVIEIAITPNRPDALGVHGIARDLAARGVGTLKTAEIAPVAGTFPCPITVRIDADTRAACPVFCGRLIRGVTNGPSPQWLQDRLTAIGLRPISFLVDVTNFFTYDRNRPLHVFDATKVQGGLRVHRAAGGEQMVGLDDKTYDFAPDMTLISDDRGPESIAGVMGGLETGVSEATTDVFVEAAYFDPIRTAMTGRALKINSDARYRFERGIDPTWTPIGLEAATRMILEHAGGEASEVVVAGEIPDVARSVTLDTERLQRLVGLSIAPDAQRDILNRLGFAIEGDTVHVPPWRPDIDGSADLVEEVARIASLTKLTAQPMARPAGVTRPILTPAQRREGMLRRTLAALGYDECVTYSFIDAAAAAPFGGDDPALMLDNPISTEMSHLRRDLLPGLLAAARRNQARGFGDLALFEIGPVFAGGEPGAQQSVATALLVGHSSGRDPHGSRRPVDPFDVKADLEAALAALGAPDRRMALRDVPDWYHPGRAARLGLGPKTTLGVFGELHPRLLSNADVKGPAMAFSVYLDALPEKRATGATRPALALSDLQAVDRDFAFVVPERTEAAEVMRAAQSADKALIEQVAIFDEFSGPQAQAQMGAGNKSLALTVRLQPRDRTLTDDEIEAVGARIVAAVEKATQGRLRG